MNDKNETIPRGSTPVPDPTILTTQQLYREIAASREIIEANIKSLETRLTGMDTATQLNKAEQEKMPRMIDEKVCQLRKIMDEKFGTVDEKFSSIDKQFRERDVRTEQTQKDSKVAVDAALQAAKEAVGEQNQSNALANSKMETAFTKQIDQIGLQIQSTTKATDDKFEDVKGRLTTLETSINTRYDITTEHRGQSNVTAYLVVVSIGIIISIFISLASVFMHMPK